MWKVDKTLVFVHRLVLFFSDVYRPIKGPTSKGMGEGEGEEGEEEEK